MDELISDRLLRNRMRTVAPWLLICACSSSGTGAGGTPVGSSNIAGRVAVVASAGTAAVVASAAAGAGAVAPPPGAAGVAGSAGSSVPATPVTPAPVVPVAGDSGAVGAAGAAVPLPTAGQPGPATPPPFLPDLVYTMSGTIDAGAEAMFCMYIRMPMDQKTAVPSAESHYTPGSHHFLIFRTNLTAVPKGEDVAHVCGDPSSTKAVTGGTNGLASGESAMGNTGSYYEAQTPDARRDLPPGVAHVFQPGEIIIATAHYLNTTDKLIDSKIEFRMRRMDPTLVKAEAGTFFLLNTTLNIPPHAQSTFTRACPIPKDINLGLLWSHMHARGHSFRAWTDDPTATQQLGGDVYVQPGPAGWEDPHIQTYPADPPITLHAGSKLMISCTYQNTTSQTFRFGQSAATAEMCLLHGMYWPRLDGATERCTNGTSTSDMATPISGM